MTNSLQPLRLSVEGGVARITLSRPDVGNPIDADFARSLDALTLEISCRADVRAVLLVSEGRYFSVGGNINEMIKNRDHLPSLIREWNGLLQPSLSRLQHLTVPTVVAVQGIAAGGGVSLLASFDIVVCSDKAKLVAAYAGLGFCPDMGGTAALVQRIGVARARRFYLLQEQIMAHEALQIGLADKVVTSDQLEIEAGDIALRWAQGPSAAYGVTRYLIKEAAFNAYDAQFALETEHMARLAATSDVHEGLSAFAEKRKPSFSGQ